MDVFGSWSRRALIAVVAAAVVAFPAAGVAFAEDGGTGPLDSPVPPGSGGGSSPGQVAPKPPKKPAKKKPAKKKPTRKKPAKKKPTRKKPAKKKPAAPPAPRTGYFPVIGSWTYGGSDMRFGAPRSGHVHQGQDVAGSEGLQIVAPTAGQIIYVGFQDYGAGYYIVERSVDGRDFVFMHLMKNSTRVRVGQVVAANKWLANLGNTGHSTGPHLHFEIWVGGWYSGGHPIDPLPQLRAWANLSRKSG